MDEPTQRDTDHSALKPSSLPPNSVTFADLVATHEAILLEMQAFRLDIENLKNLFLVKPQWVTDFLSSAEGLSARVLDLSKRLDDQQAICKFHHPTNGQ